MVDYNASDRKHIRAAEKAAATAEAQRSEVVVESMATVPRRRYVWDKLADCGIFRTTFSPDPLQMAFNEGQRNQGLVLLNDIIEHCPDQFIQAMKEHNERRSNSGSTSRSPSRELDRGEGAGWDSEGRPSEPGPGDA